MARFSGTRRGERARCEVRAPGEAWRPHLTPGFPLSRSRSGMQTISRFRQGAIRPAPNRLFKGTNVVQY